MKPGKFNSKMLTQVLTESSFKDGTNIKYFIDYGEVDKKIYDAEMKRACLFKTEKILRPCLNLDGLIFPEYKVITKYFPSPFYRN